MKSGPIDHKSTLARVMAWRLAISWTYANPVHWYIYAAPGADWVLNTSANALWHVRHFVLLLCIWSDMCTSFGAHKPRWVFRSFCYTNQCFYCECYLNLYWSVNYHCMWRMRIVICMAINLIWLDLTWYLQIDIKQASILLKSVGSMFNQCSCKGHCFLGLESCQ